ncbi:MAG: response regulator [Oligoflexales bacterium]
MTKNKVVLIDDDPGFNIIMTRVAEQMGVSLNTYESLEDLGMVSLMNSYDIAIVDYDLGKLNGLEVAHYAKSFFKGLPIYLISNQEREPNRHWPENIVKFSHKKNGYACIMQMAKKILNPKDAIINWDVYT